MKRSTLLVTLALLLACAPSRAQENGLAARGGDSAAAAREPAEDKGAPAEGAEDMPAAKMVGSVRLPPEKAQPVRLHRFQKPPVIDGKLDDAAWKTAAVLKDFYQIQPGDNLTPSQQTEVLVGYDSNFFYIAFRAADDPSKVRATVAKRDAQSGDDSVAILLDTFNDKRNAFFMGFNPLGVQSDGIYSEGTGVDFSVDIVMESKGVITEDGYTVEVAIPFKSLRYEAGKDKLWGIHIQRTISRGNSEISSWMPISRENSSWLGQAGHLTGLDGISGERTLEVIPTLTASETGKRVPQLPYGSAPGLQDSGRQLNRPVELSPGLTLKYGITPNVTLALALNPDFAQVEADQIVVTANQRFPIFFEEKRPFFLEGIEIFKTPLSPVHTRAIIDPDYAAKLTGKRGRNTFGLLFASDNGPGDYSEEERSDPLLGPSLEKFFDKNAYIGVLRLKRDIGDDSALGFLATTYNFVERHNHLGGFDGRLRFDPRTVLSFQVLGTTTRAFFFDPNAGKPVFRTGNAFGYSFNYAMDGRHFGYAVGGEGRTRDYRAEVGFTTRTNTNFNNLLLRYNSEPRPRGKLILWNASNYSGAGYDWRGRMQYWLNDSRFALVFRRQTFFNLSFTSGYERLFEEEFGPRRAPGRPGAFFGPDPERSSYKRGLSAAAGTTPNKKFSAFLYAGYTWGNLDFDFGGGPRFPRVSPAALSDPAAPLDPGAGDSLDVNLSLSYQPTSALNTSLNFTKSRLARRDTGLVAFDDNIYSLKAAYQFSRFMFARARVDYTTLASNVRAQLLFGWTPNPGTAFYVGYNDDLNYNGFSPFTGQYEPGFRRNGRTFFVKMSYLFRRSF